MEEGAGRPRLCLTVWVLKGSEEIQMIAEPFTELEAFEDTLAASQRGEEGAFEQLLAHAYSHLRTIASQVIGPQAEFQTMGPSALVHEGFLKIQLSNDLVGIQDARHFFALFTKCMKQALVDYVRQKNAKKRGGDWYRVELEAMLLSLHIPESQLYELVEAVELLREAAPRAADVFDHKTFGGQTVPEIAALMQLSVSTIEFDLRFARAFLRTKLG